MANSLPESSVWEEGIYQLEIQDPVIGGPGGISNLQATQLANRTLYLKECLYHIGAGYTQGLNDPSPSEASLPGTWEVWNHRAEGYRLRADPLPNYTIYTQGANCAVGAFVLYHLVGDDYAVFKAKEVITGAPLHLDPVKWEQSKEGEVVPRRLVQTGDEGWSEDDLSIGSQIESGEYAGLYVEEVIVLGGKFLSFAGGNRPTFLSGVQPDTMRNFTGSFSGSTIFTYDYTIRGDGGLFYESTGYSIISADSSGTRVGIRVNFDPSRKVPTGLQNSPETLPERLWRCVA
jgi:hypothetical protein